MFRWLEDDDNNDDDDDDDDVGVQAKYGDYDESTYQPGLLANEELLPQRVSCFSNSNQKLENAPSTKEPSLIIKRMVIKLLLSGDRPV